MGQSVPEHKVSIELISVSFMMVEIGSLVVKTSTVETSFIEASLIDSAWLVASATDIIVDKGIFGSSVASPHMVPEQDESSTPGEIVWLVIGQYVV